MRTITDNSASWVIPNECVFSQDENYFCITPLANTASYVVATISCAGSRTEIRFNVAQDKLVRVYLDDIFRSAISKYDKTQNIYPFGSSQIYNCAINAVLYSTRATSLSTISQSFTWVHGRTLKHRNHGSQLHYLIPAGIQQAFYFEMAQTAHYYTDGGSVTDLSVTGEGLVQVNISTSAPTIMVHETANGYQYGEVWDKHNVGNVPNPSGRAWSYAFTKQTELFNIGCPDHVWVLYYNTDGEACHLDGKVISKTTAGNGVEYPFRNGEAPTRDRARIVTERGCEIEVAFENLRADMYVEDLLISDFVWLNGVLVIPTTTQLQRGDRDVYDTTISFKFAEQ